MFVVRPDSVPFNTLPREQGEPVGRVEPDFESTLVALDVHHRRCVLRASISVFRALALVETGRTVHRVDPV